MTTNKWASIAGIIAALALVAGLLTAGGNYEVSDSDAEIVDAVEDGKAVQVVGVYFGVISALSLLVFASAGLKPRLKAACRSDGDRGLAAVVQPALAFAAAVIALGHVALGSVAATALFDDLAVDADAVRALNSVGYGAILVAGGLALAVALGATSVHALRSGSLPKWFGWLGVLATLCMLAAIVFIPLIMFPVWLIGAAIVLWRGAPGPTEAPTPA